MKKAHIVSLFSALISIISFFAYYVINSAKDFIWKGQNAENYNYIYIKLNGVLYLLGSSTFLFIIIAGFFLIIFIVSLIKGFKNGE